MNAERIRVQLAAVAGSLALCAAVQATDLAGVQSASIDQPRINAYV